MRKKILDNLRKEILETLKNGSFQYSEESNICKIFQIHMCYFSAFKVPTTKKINKESKVELLKWLEQGYIETENSEFARLITPPTFLEIMIAASQVD